MKEAVKEILSIKKDCDYKRISVDELITLKDYITELEQYNDSDLEIKQGLIDRIKRQQAIIDKAIEFIEENLTFYITIGGTDERKLIGYNKAFDELLNILKGDSSNEN